MKKTLVLLLALSGILKAQQLPTCQLFKQHLPNPSVFTAPENLRSDTADILQYTISLNITDFAGQTISGNTFVKFAPKINGLDYLCLDLLQMNIDSITYNSAPLSYSYNDTLLKVNLPAAFNTTDTLDIGVFYHGHPQGDASGWGGFYFSGAYAFNLGVGFAADPHTYGRVWHPCFDNFTEHAKYTFHISTNGGKIAYCNGALTHDTTDGSGLRTRTWVMDYPITSYLASVSVAPYTHVSWNLNGINGTVPAWLTAVPTDTTNLKNSFVHLPNAFAAHENHYGPYPYNRVGYCLVPFNSGAMEHATNISAGRAFANGATTYEVPIMAHELSHQWWGDHVTCETAGDMWLNEGMATYSEYYFTEWLSGYATYLSGIKSNHETQVHYLHYKEGWRPVSGVPSQYTYGDIVYKKGADMAHTMRGYMGDSLFKVGLRYVQQQKAFQNMNSVEFGNLLTTATGVDMNQFMTDWVLNQGWPHFSIDSARSVPAGGGNYSVTVYVRQRLFGAPNYFTNVPMELSYRNGANWHDTIQRVLVSGPLSGYTITLPYDPAMVAINMGSKISDAISSQYRLIKTTGPINFAPANLSIIVLTAGDSSFMRVEHNYVKPDSVKNNVNHYRLNDQHYWKIDGILDPVFHSKATFNFDGRPVLSGQSSYLDTILTQFTADSMILLYRRNTADDWHEVSHYTKVKQGGINGKFGYFTVDTLKLGEYASANGVSQVLVGLNENEQAEKTVVVFPNPAKNQFTISAENFDAVDCSYEVYDLSGRKLLEGKLNNKQTQVSLNSLSSGHYTVKILSGKEKISSHKIVVIKE
jgi:aminopeptidase N